MLYHSGVALSTGSSAKAETPPLQGAASVPVGLAAFLWALGTPSTAPGRCLQQALQQPSASVRLSLQLGGCAEPREPQDVAGNQQQSFPSQRRFPDTSLSWMNEEPPPGTQRLQRGQKTTPKLKPAFFWRVLQ